MTEPEEELTRRPERETSTTPERELRALAYLAYLVVESGLDSGSVKTSAITRLSTQVVKMLDAGFDFEAIADDLTGTMSGLPLDAP
jgi:hypothetical protein